MYKQVSKSRKKLAIKNPLPAMVAVWIMFLFAGTTCMGQVKIYKTYYKNRTIESIEHQGTFMGCGVPVGTDSLFNERGNLTKTAEYIHLKNQHAQGCHAIITYLKKTSYQGKNNKPVVRYYKYNYESEHVACDAKEYLAAKQKSVKKKLSPNKI